MPLPIDTSRLQVLVVFLAEPMRPGALGKACESWGLRTNADGEILCRAQLVALNGDRAQPLGESAETERLWTARRVAVHYDVDISFVYNHADELGCIRLGSGKCPRLRFDPQIVRERWPTVGKLPAPRPEPPSRPSSRPSAQRQTPSRGYDLLEFDREP